MLLSAEMQFHHLSERFGNSWLMENVCSDLQQISSALGGCFSPLKDRRSKGRRRRSTSERRRKTSKTLHFPSFSRGIGRRHSFINHSSVSAQFDAPLSVSVTCHWRSQRIAALSGTLTSLLTLKETPKTRSWRRRNDLESC